MTEFFSIKITRAVLAFSFALLSTGCGNDDGADKNGGSGAHLIMGTSADSPPFEFHTPNDPKNPITGFDVDVALALGKVMGTTIEVRDMDFGALIPALQTGRIDFVMASMTPSDERQKHVSFSDIYYVSRLAVVTLANTKTINDGSFSGKRWGVQMGSTHEMILREIAQKQKEVHILPLNKLGDMIQDVKAGRLNGAVMEVPAAKSYTQKNDDLTYTVLDQYQAGYAIASRKNADLTIRFNDALKTLKANGTLDGLVKKWLDS